MKVLAAGCLIGIGLCANGQSIKPGLAAPVPNNCDISHSENYDKITIWNCGIGKEQGEQVIGVLKKIMSSQNLNETLAELDSKLNETLVAHPKSSTVEQAGNGNQQTVNQAPISQANSGGCNQQVVGGNNNISNCHPTLVQEDCAGSPFCLQASNGGQITENVFHDNTVTLTKAQSKEEILFPNLKKRLQEHAGSPNDIQVDLEWFRGSLSPTWKQDGPDGQAASMLFEKFATQLMAVATDRGKVLSILGSYELRPINSQH